MKKLIGILMVAVFALVLSGSAYAEDRLSISGGYFARGWMQSDVLGWGDETYTFSDTEFDGYEYEIYQVAGTDPVTGAAVAAGEIGNVAQYTTTSGTLDLPSYADYKYFTQRMRVQAKIKVADDVVATIRGDMAEGTWGSSFGTGSVARPRASFTNTFDIDRTYVTITKEMWDLQVGQQYFGLGINEVMDAQITGAKLGLKFDPVKFSLTYAKISENGSTDDDVDDIDIWAANLSFDLGGFDSNLFGAFQTDGDDTTEIAVTSLPTAVSTANGVISSIMGGGLMGAVTKYGQEVEPWAVGFNASGALGIVNLTTELAFLGGDAKLCYGFDEESIDLEGLQFYVKADSNINDMLNIGAELLYAQGADVESGEVQITGLTDWWTFTPMGNNTPLDGWVTAAFAGSSLFDFTGMSAGSLGGTLFFSATPMEKLALGGKIGYFTVEEDALVDADMTSFNAWASYEIASNTKLSLTYLWVSYGVDEVIGSSSLGSEVDSFLEDTQTVVLELAVSF